MKKPYKTLSAQERKDLRRKKLVKRSKTSLLNMKGLIHHTPTDEDISKILKEFTVDFLLKGYGYLVQEIYTILISDIEMQKKMDTSHFFWLISYFLKFAAQLELDLEHIKSVLSFNILSYLTYQAVNLYEKLELTSRHLEMDLKPDLRRMHLAVTAIREFLQTLSTYTNISHLTENDRKYIHLLQLQISATEDLKQLYILLIRNYNPKVQKKQYLQDLIVTNHILLLIPDSVDDSLDIKEKTQLKEHIQQFATVEMMQKYGILLESFHDNGEFVNDCIFTMMYHIGVYFGQVTALFQPIILRVYSQIWENEYELCDDWSDLIGYVINKFINTPQKSPICIQTPHLVANMATNNKNEKEFCDDIWSKEEIDILYWYYEQSKSSTDPVGKIVKLFSKSGYKAKYRITVIQQLLQQDIINRSEYNAFMKYENEEYKRNFKFSPTKSQTSSSSGVDSVESTKQTEKPQDDIQLLKEKLINENKGKQIIWLQKILIEYCFAKLCYMRKQTLSKDCDEVRVIEPIPYHCILKKQSVPVVPWNAEQNSILLYQPFILLLHKLGFHLPADAGKLFVRIPEFWTADILFNVAKKLGPIDKSCLKFDVKELNVLPPSTTMYGSINQGKKIDMSQEQIDATNSDSNFAFPANALNTSSIISRLTRYNQARNNTILLCAGHNIEF